jgi:hypothetical protein
LGICEIQAGSTSGDFKDLLFKPMVGLKFIPICDMKIWVKDNENNGIQSIFWRNISAGYRYGWYINQT